MGIFSGYDRFVEKVNEKFGNSAVGRYFLITERGSTLSTEMRAGSVTFLAMAYILAVNASILSDTGGTCTVNDCTYNTGQPFCMFGNNGVFDPGYLACVADCKKAMITATAASALIACFLMGAGANIPLALAPGMGINAYFTYTIVGFFGTGTITYSQALAACFIEGWIFILVAISGVRGKFIQLIPKSIMLATAGGIGLFLAFIGLQASQGLGLITYDSATLVTLGGCPLSDQVPAYSVADTATVCALQNVTSSSGVTSLQAVAVGLGPSSPTFSCEGNRMRNGATWLGIFGGMMMVLCMGRNFRGSLMIGILFVTFVSWIPGHTATYLGAESQIAGGAARREYFNQVVAVPNVKKIAVAWDWSSFSNSNLWAALITFLYLDFLDTTGTLFSMATFLNRSMPGFINEKKEFPRQIIAFCVDGVSIIVGSLLGIAPLTVFIESSTGIKEGGRTGLTAIMVSFYFFLALFFSPIIASIPPYATGPALVFVGALMMENLIDIAWEDVNQAVPAFVTIAFIPLTYSIAYGVIAGIMVYIFLYVVQLCIEIMIMPFTKRSFRDIIKEATPDAFKTSVEDVSQSKLEDGLAMKPQEVEVSKRGSKDGSQ